MHAHKPPKTRRSADFAFNFTDFGPRLTENRSAWGLHDSGCSGSVSSSKKFHAATLTSPSGTIVVPVARCRLCLRLQKSDALPQRTSGDGGKNNVDALQLCVGHRWHDWWHRSGAARGRSYASARQCCPFDHARGRPSFCLPRAASIKSLILGIVVSIDNDHSGLARFTSARGGLGFCSAFAYSQALLRESQKCWRRR